MIEFNIDLDSPDTLKSIEKLKVKLRERQESYPSEIMGVWVDEATCLDACGVQLSDGLGKVSIEKVHKMPFWVNDWRKYK